MRLDMLTVVLASLLVAACGSKEPSVAGGMAATLKTLPATIEGELIAGVDEGDADEDAKSEHIFGTLTVGEENIDVVISPAILKNAALPDDVGKVRATLSSKTEEFGGSVYVVTSLQKL